MINGPFHPESELAQPTESNRLKLLAVVCAFAVTAALFTAYAYMRRRHARETLASISVPLPPDSAPKGPPLAHILIDDPLLTNGETVIGGSVKNISQQQLSGLSIELELRRRQDSGLEQVSVVLVPAQLQPQQEANYSFRLQSQKYGSIRYIGLKADPQAALIAYTSSPGKKRPPERLQPKIMVQKSSTRKGEFLNTPDNPTRVP